MLVLIGLLQLVGGLLLGNYLIVVDISTIGDQRLIFEIFLSGFSIILGSIYIFIGLIDNLGVK